MEPYYFSYSGLFNAITSFLLGVFVLCKNFKSHTNRSYAVFAFSVTLWAINYFVWLMSNQANHALFFIRFAMVGAILIPAAYTHFITCLLNQKRRLLDFTNIIMAGMFVSLSFSPIYIQKVEFRSIFPFWPVPGWLFHLMLFYFMFNVLYVIIVLWTEMKKVQSTRRMQIKYVFFGTVIGYFGGCTNYFLWYSVPILPYLNFLVSGFVFCAAYAIVKHQLMDIEIIVKKTLVFAGLFAVSYAVFASFAYLSSIVFENITQNRWIALVPSIFVIVLILRPLESFLRNITDRYLFQKRYDYRELLRTFSDEVLTVLDLDILVNLTVNKLAEVVKLQNASIMLYDDAREEFRMAASADEEMPIYTFRGDDEFITYIRKSGQYFLKDDSNKRRGLKKSIDEKMEELGADLIVPLVHGEEMVGALFFGAKKSDELFTQDDIDILLSLARTLSIAITNASLFEKLSEAQAQAAQREKMAVIGTLSAGINHEICNPLGIARGQCEMFLLNLADGVYKDKTQNEILDKAKEIMDKVINETDRATVITRKLSTFSKPAKGETADDVRIEKELEEVVSLVEHDLKLDDIIIEKDIEESIPCISADRKQIQEILFNLIRNAAQSIGEKGRIAIRARNSGKKVHIDIEDTGSGISKENMARIFNPFFTTKEPGKGTGLGLFIVKQIVERNNGRISVQSELNKGTTFNLTFNAA